MELRAWWRGVREHEDEKALERMTLDAELGKTFRESSTHEEEELADE
jgi:hypothetical protein